MRTSTLLLVLVTCSPATSVRAWCRMTTSMASAGGGCVRDGVPLAWKRRCTSYRFFEAGTPDMPLADVRAVARASFGAWSAITCPDGSTPDLEAHEGAELSLCDRPEYDASGGNVGTIVFVPAGSWTSRGYDPSAYAVTTVWHASDTGEIFDVDMELNEDLGPYAHCSDIGCTPGVTDLGNVMTHEAGHWFGLAHSPDDSSATMWASVAEGEVSKRTLAADDIAGFCGAYHQMDPSSSCDDTPHGGLALMCGGASTGGAAHSGGCNVPRDSQRDDGGLALVALGVVLAAVIARRRRAVA